MSQEAQLWLSRGAKMQGLEKNNDIGRPCNRMDLYTSSPLNVYREADGLARGMETSPPDDYMYHQHSNPVLSSHCLQCHSFPAQSPFDVLVAVKRANVLE